MEAVPPPSRGGPRLQFYRLRDIIKFRCRYINRWSAGLPARGGENVMGSGRWAQALRIVVWFVIVFLLMILTAQKAC